jgi:hypothetical protein
MLMPTMHHVVISSAAGTVLVPLIHYMPPPVAVCWCESIRIDSNASEHDPVKEQANKRLLHNSGEHESD